MMGGMSNIQNSKCKNMKLDDIKLLVGHGQIMANISIFRNAFKSKCKCNLYGWTLSRYDRRSKKYISFI